MIVFAAVLNPKSYDGQMDEESGDLCQADEGREARVSSG